MMFFLRFIYSWIFLRPQLSSFLPALSCLCQGNRTRAAAWGVEGISPESSTWPSVAACFPPAPGAWVFLPLLLAGQETKQVKQLQKRHQRCLGEGFWVAVLLGKPSP